MRARCASALEAAPVIDAVLTLGPPGAEAVLAGSEGLSGGRQVPHLTFDVAQLQIDGIRSGRILATIDSQQYLARLSLGRGDVAAQGQGFTLASDIHTGPAIVDAFNLAAAEDGVRRGYR